MKKAVVLIALINFFDSIIDPEQPKTVTDAIGVNDNKLSSDGIATVDDLRCSVVHRERHGSMTCTMSASKMQCTLTCDSGYYFGIFRQKQIIAECNTQENFWMPPLWACQKTQETTAPKRFISHRTSLEPPFAASPTYLMKKRSKCPCSKCAEPKVGYPAGTSAPPRLRSHKALKELVPPAEAFVRHGETIMEKQLKWPCSECAGRIGHPKLGHPTTETSAPTRLTSHRTSLVPLFAASPTYLMEKRSKLPCSGCATSKVEHPTESSIIVSETSYSIPHENPAERSTSDGLSEDFKRRFESIMKGLSNTTSESSGPDDLNVISETSTLGSSAKKNTCIVSTMEGIAFIGFVIFSLCIRCFCVSCYFFVNHTSRLNIV